MFPVARPFWAFVLVASAGLSAFAQSTPAQPGAPSTAAPSQLGFRSTFEAYKPFTDESVGSWKDANDTVGRIGGWRAYAKEARDKEPAAAGAPDKLREPAQTAPAARPSGGGTPSGTDPHAGHGKQ